jgi:hypothetical protein
MVGTNIGAKTGSNSNQPYMPYMTGLNLLDLNKLINNHIHYDPNWTSMPTKLPSNIPKFEGKTGEDPSNHIMSFNLWCSSNSIMEYSVRLRIFQCTLMGVVSKWYVYQPTNTHTSFASITKVFFTFFQLPVFHGVGIDIFTSFYQITATHITDHIHEWHKRHDLYKANINDIHGLVPEVLRLYPLLCLRVRRKISIRYNSMTSYMPSLGICIPFSLMPLTLAQVTCLHRGHPMKIMVLLGPCYYTHELSIVT